MRTWLLVSPIPGVAPVTRTVPPLMLIGICTRPGPDMEKGPIKAHTSPSSTPIETDEPTVGPWLLKTHGGNIPSWIRKSWLRGPDLPAYFSPLSGRVAPRTGGTPLSSLGPRLGRIRAMLRCLINFVWSISSHSSELVMLLDGLSHFPPAPHSLAEGHNVPIPGFEGLSRLMSHLQMGTVLMVLSSTRACSVWSHVSMVRSLHPRA